ncbi:hypothetical protein B0H19DRAFT_1080708 [Mycena capillaripes]|nr:hypothetical protein B0H19DRAFT_1080708 [Mycena capillaripes]
MFRSSRILRQSRGIRGEYDGSHVSGAWRRGDLILFEHFVDLYRHSPLLTVYIYAYCEASNYLQSTLQQHRRITSLNGPDQAARVIDALTLQQYHKICWSYLKCYRTTSIPIDATVNFGAVLACSQANQREAMGEIAFLPDVEASGSGWYGAEGEVMENGWTRFDSCDVLDSQLTVDIWWNSLSHRWSWLSQGNHIFSSLQITSNLENFVTRSIVVIEGISFRLKFSVTAEDVPSGYLFLCPESEFHAGVSSSRYPARPAFWSLDPAGDENLSLEEATDFGFPTIEPTIEAWGRSWDPTVYTGLRQFHHGNGFDPDSQDIAKHLGQPLFRLSRDMEPLLAHVKCHWWQENAETSMQGMSRKELRNCVKEESTVRGSDVDINTSTQTIWQGKVPDGRERHIGEESRPSYKNGKDPQRKDRKRAQSET